MVVGLAGLLADFWPLASILQDASLVHYRGRPTGVLARVVIVLIQPNAKCYDSPMATTLSIPLQTLSLQSQVQPLSLQTLPDDIQQRVLAGIPLDDHQATASACKAFRAVIRGPKFLALRIPRSGR